MLSEDGHIQKMVRTECFINAENAIQMSTEPIQSIVLSFGDEESEVIDRLVSVADAREIVCDLLRCLANINDPIAIVLQNTLAEYLDGETE